MSHGIYRAVSGSLAQMRRLDVLANNLAHVDTPGYKADRLRFEEALDQAGGRTRFVNTPKTHTQLTQGAVRRTDNPLDVAIMGDGFFVVDTAEGDRLTRAGRFVVGPDGLLRTVKGDAVQGEGGPIAIPPPGAAGSSQISIDPQGQVRVGDLTVGRLKRVQAKADEITKADSQHFVANAGVDALPDAVGGEVLQGHLEEANVNPVVAMTQMVAVQRNFEAIQQAVRTYRDIDSQSARRLG